MRELLLVNCKHRLNILDRKEERGEFHPRSASACVDRSRPARMRACCCGENGGRLFLGQMVNSLARPNTSPLRAGRIEGRNEAVDCKYWRVSSWPVGIRLLARKAADRAQQRVCRAKHRRWSKVRGAGAHLDVGVGGGGARVGRSRSASAANPRPARPRAAAATRSTGMRGDAGICTTFPNTIPPKLPEIPSSSFGPLEITSTNKVPKS
jgi:hypothetical protein